MATERNPRFVVLNSRICTTACASSGEQAIVPNDIRTASALISVAAAIFFPLVASAHGTAVDLGVGTLGASLSLSQAIDPQTAVRATFGTFDLARNEQFNNVVIDVLTNLRLTERFRVQTAGLYVDRSLHGGLHLSAGAVFNGNHIAAVSVPADSSIVLNGSVYSAAQAGQIFTDVKWMPVSPYVGFGFAPRLTDRRRVGFVGQFGAYYQGRANVTFDSNGIIKANESNFIRYYNTLRDQLAQELSPVQVFPVVQLGIRFKI